MLNIGLLCFRDFNLGQDCEIAQKQWLKPPDRCLLHLPFCNEETAIKSERSFTRCNSEKSIAHHMRLCLSMMPWLVCSIGCRCTIRGTDSASRSEVGRNSF